MGASRTRKRESPPCGALQDAGNTFAGALKTLLASLDADIALRNQHTHDKFRPIGIWTGDDIFDPADAFVDFSERPEQHQQLSDFLREEIDRLVDEHVAK